MGASNSNSKKVTFFSLKAKVDATNKPFFGKSEKVNEKWQITDTFDTISGFLIGAEIVVKEFEGAKQNIFKLKFEDGEDNMQVEMTHNNLTYSIINTLAGLTDTFSKIEIQVWRNDKDGKFFGNASIKFGNEKMQWSFAPATAPKKEPVTDKKGQPIMQNGKQLYDATELKAFYENVFISKVIPLCQTKATPATMDSPDEQSDPGSDDLPFMWILIPFALGLITQMA